MTDNEETRLVIGGAGGGGKGGGGGKPDKPKEEDDNLASTQIATVIDLISEGEIEGIVGDFKGVFLNNVPVQNENGSFNYPNIFGETRLGWQNQEPLLAADDVEQIFAVSTEVKVSTGPVTRTITDSNVDAVRFTMVVPRLEKIEDDGDIEGTKVRFRFAFLYANASDFVESGTLEIEGRTIDPYAASYRFTFPDDPDIFPVQIRVIRVTEDSESSKLINGLVWQSYTEIIEETLTYPNSALVGLTFSAEQFASIPSRSYLVRGIKVAIPSNATVDQDTGGLTYEGVWDGTFQQAQWCADPAWILWDLLTAERYGLGDHIPYETLDRYSFFAASQYANEMVPDGIGGEEARFLCNVNLQRIDEAYKVINDLASVFRAMPYWAAGSVIISQDRPQDASYVFNLSNVTEEGFNYQNSSQKTKANVALVRYFDNEQRDIAYEIAEDEESIEKYGVIKRQVEAFGCTSRGQAKRVGEWLIYTEANESEVVNFTTTIDAGVILRPGMIIEVNDPVKAGIRQGGRIIASTNTSITIDDISATQVFAGNGAKISVVLPDGTVQTNLVNTTQGPIINIDEGYFQKPNVNAPWTFQSNTVESTYWRVFNVTEKEDVTYEISAVAYNESKFDAIEQGLYLDAPSTTTLSLEPPQTPTNLTAQEVPYTDANGVQQTRILVSWQGGPQTSSFQVRYRIDSSNWRERTTNASDIDIYEVTPGIYKFEVFAIGANNQFSTQPAKLTKSIQGVFTAVEDVQNFTVSGSADNQVLLTWDEPLGSNVVGNGKVYIRHTQDTVSPQWASSLPVTSVDSAFTQAIVPAITGVYLARFESSAGILSPNSAQAPFTYVSTTTQSLLSANRQDPTFTGAKTNTQVTPALFNLITQGGDQLITQSGDSFTGGNVGANDHLEILDVTLLSGDYTFTNYVDLGAKFTPNLERHLLTNSFYRSRLIDDQTDLIDTWGLFDFDEPDATNVVVSARATDDDPAGTPTWGAWTPIINGSLSGRGFQFKADLSTTNAAENVGIVELGVGVSLVQRTEIATTSGQTTINVTFVDAFYSAPLVQVSPNSSLPSGVTYSVGSITRTGFVLTLTGAAVSYDFTYTAVGVGKEI